MGFNFVKMHGAGNDFIVFEDLNNKYLDLKTLAKALCDRHFGIGGDGLLVVKKSDIADIKMEIINADGSYAEMCGNGIRCFAKFVYEEKIRNKEVMHIETGDGVKTAKLFIEDDKVEKVCINMGKPSFNPLDFKYDGKEEVINKTVNINNKDYNITSMLMGVPHTVIIDYEDITPVEEGRSIEKHPSFLQGTNVNFCKVIDRNNMEVRTWERGAGATLACGTGSCASVVAANKLGLIDNKVNVKIPGGELFIEITDDGVLMTGPCKIVFRGII